jgi:hypothetical protein
MSRTACRSIDHGRAGSRRRAGTRSTPSRTARGPPRRGRGPPRVRVEVRDRQGGTRDPRHRVALHHETPEGPCAAFRRLRQQQAATSVQVRQCLAVQLRVLQLELCLGTPLQGVPQAGRHVLVHPLRQPHHEDVAPILHERDHPGPSVSRPRRPRDRHVHGRVRRLLVGEPPSVHRVEPEPALVLVFRRFRPTFAMRMVAESP